MPSDVRSFLWDIQKAADAIDQFVAGLDARAYSESDVVHSAVERKFEIIGEALGQIAKRDPSLAGRIPNFREIIAFRNILIHGYASVVHERVWKIAQASLPNLRAAIATLLRELGSS
ncbi:MAG: HepT-like ribonuclease domain-containing protein [Roseiarcus sp.]|jgi:uncharacterized protein with HEPN domain